MDKQLSRRYSVKIIYSPIQNRIIDIGITDTGICKMEQKIGEGEILHTVAEKLSSSGAYLLARKIRLGAHRVMHLEKPIPPRRAAEKATHKIRRQQVKFVENN